MLRNLRKLTDYLHALAGAPGMPPVHVVADESQGTLALNSPARITPQIVIALPNATLSGNSDSMTGPLGFILFALDKEQAQAATADSRKSSYDRTAELLGSVLRKILDDISGGADGDRCPLLGGMDASEITVLPEAGIFGGWNGWSATITIR